MDYSYLNSSNLPASFSEDLLSTRELYFRSERAQDWDDQDFQQSDSEDEDFDLENTDFELPIEWRECDNIDHQKVEKFLRQGCGCSSGPQGEGCSNQFPMERVQKYRDICLELTSSELDMAILSQLQACTREEELASSSRQTTSRKRPRTFHTFQGARICQEMFLILHGIGLKRLKNLKSHYKEHGILPRVHGNKGRPPSRTCTIEAVQRVVTFLDNYTEEHAIALPGRIPGFKRSDMKLLPSSLTKASIHRIYEQSAAAADLPAVSYSKFVDLWNELRPYIRITKPMTDLCHTCQKNNTSIYRSANLPDEEKSDIVKKQEEHLLNAERERSLYKSACSQSKTALSPVLAHLDFNETRAPCSFQGKMHYSFDYAQQVHLPSNPMQPGPIYFKVPRKVGIFGVCCESLPRQVNFLIDEAANFGKGANATISYLHYFFQNHGVGETDVHLHADNCCGQNKNSYVLWYLAWRTAMGLHHSCLYSFLMVGHTKFACDWCFGLLKQLFRKSFVSSLFELAAVVHNSTVSGVNVAQLCGLHDGSILVPVYDWVSFLAPYFRKFPSIKKYHHFRFEKENPGCVFFKQYSDSVEEKFNLSREVGVLPPRTLPIPLEPKGLDQQRKLYLFNDIRQFCKEGTEDLIAPQP